MPSDAPAWVWRPPASPAPAAGSGEGVISGHFRADFLPKFMEIQLLPFMPGRYTDSTSDR